MFRVKRAGRKRARDRLRRLRDALLQPGEDSPTPDSPNNVPQDWLPDDGDPPPLVDGHVEAEDDVHAPPSPPSEPDDGAADWYEVRLADPDSDDPDDCPVSGDVEGEAGRKWPEAASVDDVCLFLAGLQARREVPIAVLADVLEYMKENRNLFRDQLEASTLPTFRAMRERALKHIPTAYLDATFLDSNGSLHKFEALTAYPKSQARANGWSRHYVLYYVRFQAIVAFHEQLHPDAERPTFFDLSLDGVPESKSGGTSVDVLSVRFSNCKTIYSLAVLQPARKGLGLPEDVTLRRFLEEYPSVGLRLRYVIADAPKRASLAGLKQHSALNACQYCLASKEDRVFKSNSMGEPERTNDMIRSVAEQLERHEIADADAHGVKKRSPLASIETLDLVRDLPAEKMHMCDLGIIRKIVKLSFKCVQVKAKQVPFVRATDEALNAELVKCSGVPNFARRTRPLDIANYKAEEFRNLAIVYWPVVGRNMPAQVSNIWFLTCYIYRAMLLPDNWYRKLVRVVDVEELMHLWYTEFERVFGETNCSFYVHVFHHMPHIRAHAPLTVTSAVAYESHYNILKKSYRAGTCSMGIQAMRNSLLANMYSHNCWHSRKISGRVTEKTDDSVCFVDGVGVFKVEEATDTHVTGRRMATADRNEVVPGLDFSSVLCFKCVAGADQGPCVTYPLSRILGKCVVVDDQASVVPWAVLGDH